MRKARDGGTHPYSVPLTEYPISQSQGGHACIKGHGMAWLRFAWPGLAWAYAPAPGDDSRKGQTANFAEPRPRETIITKVVIWGRARERERERERERDRQRDHNDR